MRHFKNQQIPLNLSPNQLKFNAQTTILDRILTTIVKTTLALRQVPIGFMNGCSVALGDEADLNEK